MNDDLSSNYSAGLGGFIAFFLLAIALWLLMRNMNGRMRRMAYAEKHDGSASDGSGQPAGDPAAGPDPVVAAQPAPDEAGHAASERTGAPRGQTSGADSVRPGHAEDGEVDRDDVR